MLNNSHDVNISVGTYIYFEVRNKISVGVILKIDSD